MGGASGGRQSRGQSPPPAKQAGLYDSAVTYNYVVQGRQMHKHMYIYTGTMYVHVCTTSLYINNNFKMTREHTHTHTHMHIHCTCTRVHNNVMR